jgi:transcription factor SPN1
METDAGKGEGGISIVLLSDFRIRNLETESWSRPILKRSSSYRDRQQARREYQADPTRSMLRIAKSVQPASQVSSQRARIPESVTGNAFRFAPITSVSDHPEESRINSQKINKFKRSMQAAKQR